jgi:hypothetical protein
MRYGADSLPLPIFCLTVKEHPKPLMPPRPSLLRHGGSEVDAPSGQAVPAPRAHSAPDGAQQHDDTAADEIPSRPSSGAEGPGSTEASHTTILRQPPDSAESSALFCRMLIHRPA